MNDELQRLVDALAARLERPVVLEDRRQRMVAYSQHGGPMDAVRRDSILQRETTPQVIAWLRRFGIVESSTAVRIPGNELLDLLPRVCIPVRHQDLLLGFLWFIDADGNMGDEEVGLASKMADEFALALYRENLAGELAQRRETEAVRNLLVRDPAARTHAAMELIDGASFLSDAGVAALAVAPVLDCEVVADSDLVRLALEQSLVQARRRVPPRHALHLLRFDHGLLLAAAGHGRTADASSHAQHLVRAMENALLGHPGFVRVVVGIGEVQADLAGAHVSIEQAQQAAEVAKSMPGLGPVAMWSELGVYRALARLSQDELGETALHPGLEALLTQDDRTLAGTLETYLDLAGNVQAAAAELQLHRATLYYRLQRIEQITGANLKDGNDRLTLHLGLKLARLSGRYSPT